ncbi:ABC transporter ATP-binding protein [Paracoccus sp. (in: a-proteobacteria)]|uniref:ABC transporter ATP-binding protein n=1 Tax=Paracoccus sp. TaxID=267 RepID=UPI00396CA13B
MRLEAEGLSLRRGRARLVQDVTLTVAPNEVLGLVGPNGAGKSSLLRLLTGLARPTTGQVRLDGQPLSRLGPRAIAQRLAFVAQAADTTERLSVRDAVELGRTPWLTALRPWSEADDRHVARALARVGLGGFENRDWSSLSGGERQRVHIARALAQDPRVLLLDEPTNHLDIRHQLSILSLLRQLQLTTVVALHDLNQAMGCDRVAVMQGGHLVALGPPAQVLTPDLLARVFGVRAHELTDPVDGTRVLRFQP